MASDRRNTAKSVKTLIVMLQALRGRQLVVTLRNDTKAFGELVDVDSHMNIELRRAHIQADRFYLTPSGEKAQQPPEHAAAAAAAAAAADDDDSDLPEADQPQPGQTIGRPAGAHEQALSTTAQQQVQSLGQLEQRSTRVQVAGPGDTGPRQADAQQQHDYLVIKGSRVRHVDVPGADCDLLGQARAEIQRIRRRRKQWSKRDIVQPGGQQC